MTKAVSIATVANMLEKHGFVLAQVKGVHHVFVHADKTKPKIFLPASGSLVRPPYLLAMRRILDESGIIAAATFDRLIAKRP